MSWILVRRDGDISLRLLGYVVPQRGLTLGRTWGIVTELTSGLLLFLAWIFGDTQNA